MKLKVFWSFQILLDLFYQLLSSLDKTLSHKFIGENHSQNGDLMEKLQATKFRGIFVI